MVSRLPFILLGSTSSSISSRVSSPIQILGIRIVGIEIGHLVPAAFVWRHMILGYVDAPRIARVAGDADDFLKQRLAVARQQPIDEHLGRVGMGRAVHQRQRTERRRQVDAFLEMKGFELIHRQPLILGSVNLAALDRQNQANLPEPSQSTAWRRSALIVTSISLNKRRRYFGPSSGL